MCRLVGLSLADVVFCIAGVLIELGTHMVVIGKKVSNKVVAIVYHWLKTDDDVVFENERFELGDQDWIHHRH